MGANVNQCSHQAYHTGKVGDIAPQPTGKGKELLFVYKRPSSCEACAREQGNVPPCWDPTPTVSVSIDVETSPMESGDPELFDASDAFLLVEFGSGFAGVKNSLELDLLNSTSLPLVAESANFYVVYPQREFDPQVPIVQPVLRVAISVGERDYGSSGPRAPRRSVLVGDLVFEDSPVVSALLPIPKYAVGAIYSSTSKTATVDMIQFSNSVGTPNVALTRQAMLKPEYQSIPILNGARGFQILTSATALRTVVIFYLGPA